jgi:hypothetical protein
MKIKIVILCFLILSIISCGSTKRETRLHENRYDISAFPTLPAQEVKVPDGFLDLKWGSSSQQFLELSNPPPSRLSKTGVKGQMVGHRPVSSLGGAGVSGAMYYFYDDQFYEGVILYKDEETFRILYDALVMKYGKPKIGGYGNGGFGAWGWLLEETVEIALSKFNKPSSKPGAEGILGVLRYEYRPIRIRHEKETSEQTKDAL